MKYIVLIAVTAILLLHWIDAFPHSSVGGAMMVALAFLTGAFAVGVHDAWSKRRGVLGWIGSIGVALAGGLVAALFGSTIMDAILPQLHLEGSLVQTRHPMLYVTSVAMMLATLLGSWVALAIVGRWR